MSAEERITPRARPQASRPDFPKTYGIPKTKKDLLPWRHAVERLERAKNYWVCTVRPDGRPHAVPVWGIWLDDKLYYGGGPDTLHIRNVAANPNVSVHLESGEDVMIIEGVARRAGKPGRELAVRLADASRAKYGYAPEPSESDQEGSYVVTPKVVLAWSKFPKDVTRWTFEA